MTLYPSNMTLDERERLAYISGDVRAATLLGLAIDCESDAIAEAEHETEAAKREADCLRTDLDFAEEEIKELRARIADLENLA